MAGAGLALLACSVVVAADLYNPREPFSLTSDRRARQPGDVLTVLIYEASTASNTTGGGSAKSFGLSGSIGSTQGTTHGGQLALGDNSTSTGRIERTGRVVAQISVSVENVFANGDLLVGGEQAIDINGERTNIRLRGRLRAIDIAENNTVLSTRLAQAQIDFSGNGYLTERSRPGLIPRFLNWVGLW